jgi:hypothetical protein
VNTRSVGQRDPVHSIRSKLSANSSNLLHTAWTGRYVNLSHKIEVTGIACIILCSKKSIQKDMLVPKPHSRYS